MIRSTVGFSKQQYRSGLDACSAALCVRGAGTRAPIVACSRCARGGHAKGHAPRAVVLYYRALFAKSRIEKTVVTPCSQIIARNLDGCMLCIIQLFPRPSVTLSTALCTKAT